MASDSKPFLEVTGVPDVLADAAAKIVLRAFLDWATDASWALWDCNMDHVNAAWTKVYAELEEVGLAYEPDDEEDGGYLHQIRLEVAWLPSMRGELGYVYEDTSFLEDVVGYEQGVIYLPSNKANRAYVPGAGLADVIRHEYAHAWHWLEPEFFKTGWFEETFGADYDDVGNAPFIDWWTMLEADQRFRRSYDRARTKREKARMIEEARADEFVSWYAATMPCEDFAETFMTFLRYRDSLDRFRSRRGVFRKVKAVEKSVARARRELGL